MSSGLVKLFLVSIQRVVAGAKAPKLVGGIASGHYGGVGWLYLELAEIWFSFYASSKTMCWF